MKKTHTLLLALPLMFALGACNKSPEKDSVADALDQRPHEQTRDAVEDAGDAAKDAAGDAKDAAKDAGQAIKEGAGDVKDAVTGDKK